MIVQSQSWQIRDHDAFLAAVHDQRSAVQQVVATQKRVMYEVFRRMRHAVFGKIPGRGHHHALHEAQVPRNDSLAGEKSVTNAQVAPVRHHPYRPQRQRQINDNVGMPALKSRDPSDEKAVSDGARRRDTYRVRLRFRTRNSSIAELPESLHAIFDRFEQPYASRIEFDAIGFSFEQRPAHHLFKPDKPARSCRRRYRKFLSGRCHGARPDRRQKDFKVLGFVNRPHGCVKNKTVLPNRDLLQLYGTSKIELGQDDRVFLTRRINHRRS